jgi:hypothetical protein
MFAIPHPLPPPLGLKVGWWWEKKRKEKHKTYKKVI